MPAHFGRLGAPRAHTWHAYVIGEHGDSSFPVWSSATPDRGHRADEVHELRRGGCRRSHRARDRARREAHTRGLGPRRGGRWNRRRGAHRALRGRTRGVERQLILGMSQDEHQRLQRSAAVLEAAYQSLTGPAGPARMTPSDFAFLPAWSPSARGIRVTRHARRLASWLSSIVPAAASSAGDPVTRTEPAPRSLSACGLARHVVPADRASRAASVWAACHRDDAPARQPIRTTSPSAMPHMGARKPPSAGVTRVGHSVRCGDERSAATTRSRLSTGVLPYARSDSRGGRKSLPSLPSELGPSRCRRAGSGAAGRSPTGTFPA